MDTNSKIGVLWVLSYAALVILSVPLMVELKFSATGIVLCSVLVLPFVANLPGLLLLKRPTEVKR